MASLAESWSRLPKQQQLIIRYGIPVVIILVSGWFAWNKLVELGSHVLEPDEGITHEEVKLPSFLAVDGDSSSYGGQASTVVLQINENKQIIARMGKVIKELEELRLQKVALETQLPTEDNRGEMRQRIENLARGSVELKSVRINVPPTAGARPATSRSKYATVSPMYLDVQVLGDQDGIIQFINEIERNVENGGRLLIVKSFSIRPGIVSLPPGAAEPAKTKHSAQLQILTYVLNGKDGR